MEHVCFQSKASHTSAGKVIFVAVLTWIDHIRNGPRAVNRWRVAFVFGTKKGRDNINGLISFSKSNVSNLAITRILLSF